MYPLDDTIAAVATPPGGAVRGMLRISGPGAADCVQQCFRPQTPMEWSVCAGPRAIAGSLRLPQIASPLPCDLFLWPEGRSYTGQPVAEIHTLGSPPLLQAALRALCAAGARMAEPGEFTLRAVLAGRIDLSQAEAVLGVIDAADPGELHVALTQLAGGLAAPLKQLRDSLLELLSHLETGFDFADEDLPFITAEELNGRLAEVADCVARLARQTTSRTHTDEAFRVVLMGSPNTGKSSLFNALARDAEALVADRPGTTRDYLTAELSIGGIKCRLVDTAGLAIDPDESPAEVHGAARAAAREQARRARLQLLCLDSTRPLDDWERRQLEKKGISPICRNGPDAASHKLDLSPFSLVVLTKIDAPRATDFCGRAVQTSSVTGQGLEALREEIRLAVLTAAASGGEVVAATAVRCHESLRLAAAALRRAERLAQSGYGEELIAAEVRLALEELGSVAGTVYTDDLLDRIFSRFCIGK